MVEEKKSYVSTLPQFDISNEAFREYIYPDKSVLHVEAPKTLILEKNPTGDRHRLILKDGDREAGMYVKPGWLAIRWQTPDGQHGIGF